MKKVILGGVAAIVIAILAAVNVNLNSQSENLLSDLALANVEALAKEGEIIVGDLCMYSYANFCTNWDGSSWMVYINVIKV
jgi:hypothetical protein